MPFGGAGVKLHAKELCWRLGSCAGTATFGSDPTARFDGPISLSLDEAGNVYVGDRFNRVVRMFERETGAVTTIAGCAGADRDRANDPSERDPRTLNLPEISSMDYDGGRLYVPTDLARGSGDLTSRCPHIRSLRLRAWQRPSGATTDSTN